MHKMRPIATDVARSVVCVSVCVSVRVKLTAELTVWWLTLGAQGTIIGWVEVTHGQRQFGGCPTH